MRTIKFRAWDKADKIMIENLFEKVIINRYGGVVAQSHLEVMQFTGLLDKNGKEIFEGDIIQDEDGWKKVVTYNEDVWEEGCYHYAGFSFLNSADQIEVIGNIYENPELISVIN